MLETFEEIIRREEATVALVSGDVIGYYLHDNVSVGPFVREYDCMVERLQNKGVLPPSKVSRRTQAALRRDYQGRGLSTHMARSLAELTIQRYETWFSVVHRDNMTLPASVRVGWRVVGEENDWIQVALDARLLLGG